MTRGRTHSFTFSPTEKGRVEAATFIHNTTWNSLPAPVQRKVKMCLLDDLGAVIAGTLTRVNHVAADYPSRCMAGDDATILLHGKRASVAGAAFANGCAANGVDTD